jgi:hypothetical protein
VGEQLAYIAALAVGAALVYGDRPKADTYKRLRTVPSIADLDRAFGLQARELALACIGSSRLLLPKVLSQVLLLLLLLLGPL